MRWYSVWCFIYLNSCNVRLVSTIWCLFASYVFCFGYFHFNVNPPGLPPLRIWPWCCVWVSLFSRCETIEIQVRVRKRSMAGKSEIRKLFVRGDTIELVNPEKRMFRSQSKMFPLSDLTAVCSTCVVECIWYFGVLAIIYWSMCFCGGIVLSLMECYE